ERVHSMKDEKGKIPDDSLKIFYQLLDTTYQYHTLECDAICYEFLNAHYIEIKRLGKDSFVCRTETNIATHSQLILNITKDYCLAQIELNSINSSKRNILYECTGGHIKIVKEKWKNGMMKAEFNFQFFDPANPDKPLFWKG